MPPHQRKKVAPINNKSKITKNSKEALIVKTYTSKGLFFVLIIFVAAVASWGYSKYQRRRLFTPFSAPLAKDVMKSKERDNEMLWGTYRSNLYFGMRTRTPESLLFSFSWFAMHPKSGKLALRHVCEQGDNLSKYGWLYHDGKRFGDQVIDDDDFTLRTQFIKKPFGNHGGDWTLRVKGKQTGSAQWKQVVSLLFAVSNEGDETLQYNVMDDKLTEVFGKTKTLGNFRLKFLDPDKGNVQLHSFLVSSESDIYDAKSNVINNLKYAQSRDKVHDKYLALKGVKKLEGGQKPNFLVHQVVVTLPFEIDILFESESNEYREEPLKGQYFTDELRKHKEQFDKEFGEKFGLKSPEIPKKKLSFAKAAFSNMIGGIGYFYGSSKVISNDYTEPVDYWDSSLYSGVPSRSFFPRGFLWDEGFHQLQIQVWDSSITQDVMAHWFDLLNVNGWIPREEILGIEARKKVPDEFVVQHNKNANPPTFYLAIESLIDHDKKLYGHLSPGLKAYLTHIYPRLQVWFEWYNTTQKGKQPDTYRWHGRDEKSNRELNPKTLTSGLDDYPRASHPSDDERHVDLYCWIALAAGILADIADEIGEKSEIYRGTEKYLKDNQHLDKLHWSEQLQMYADYGNHTTHTKLKEVQVSKHPNAPFKLVRVVTSKHGPTLKFVNEFGYVSLFPFLLKILKPDSVKLSLILKDMRDPKKLWTNYGLRSLSQTASMYDKYNTEGDKPYWRGPIWMNLNFLAVKSLFYYSKQDGPYQEDCNRLYKELRHNLIENVFKQYTETGYIWEQYNDKDGKGQGCYPFTGWSALVTLIMAEKY